MRNESYNGVFAWRYSVVYSDWRLLLTRWQLMQEKHFSWVGFIYFCLSLKKYNNFQKFEKLFENFERKRLKLKLTCSWRFGNFSATQRRIWCLVDSNHSIFTISFYWCLLSLLTECSQSAKVVAHFDELRWRGACPKNL